MNSFNITTSFKFQYTIEAASKELAEEEAEKLFRKEIGETNGSYRYSTKKAALRRLLRWRSVLLRQIGC